jgi:hypothetical protein
VARGIGAGLGPVAPAAAAAGAAIPITAPAVTAIAKIRFIGRIIPPEIE